MAENLSERKGIKGEQKSAMRKVACPLFLLVIVGPTAVGKTKIGIELAEKLGGEIVSADSRQMYRSMNIGTAKPSREDMQRIPHHMIDVVNPDEEYTVADYACGARAAIKSISEKSLE